MRDIEREIELLREDVADMEDRVVFLETERREPLILDFQIAVIGDEISRTKRAIVKALNHLDDLMRLL